MTSQSNLMYPDVLGTITDKCINVGSLQYAVGAFPRRAHLNQPLEIVVVLQNMVLQNMRVKVSIRPPEMDKQGNLAVIQVEKRMISLGLRPGEVGVLRIPIMPLPPTIAGNDYPVAIAVRYRVADVNGRLIRLPYGGVVPSVLNISPFKLHALQNITYDVVKWYQSSEIVTTHFDVAKKIMPRVGNPPSPVYETLWSSEEMQDEALFVGKNEPEARKIVADFSFVGFYGVLRELVRDLFKLRGMNLHIGEAEVITRMVFFVIDGVVRSVDNMILADVRWFMTLCQLVAHHPEVKDMRFDEIIKNYLFEVLIFDAILVAYRLLEKDESVSGILEGQGDMYANKVVMWLAGEGMAEGRYLYEPLVFGGILLSYHDFVGAADPWDTLDAIREASQMRLRLSDESDATLFDITDLLLAHAEQILILMKIQRR